MQTNDQIYYTLGLLGYTGTIDDRIYKYLGDQGYLGALNDRLRTFFLAQGYVGTFTDQYAQWRAAGYPFEQEFSPLSLFASGEQGVWYDPSDFVADWRRNLLEDSETSPSSSSITVTSTEVVSPTGELASYLVTTNAVSTITVGTSNKNNLTIFGGSPFTHSVYAKYDSLQYLYLGHHNNGGYYAIAIFDILNGTVIDVGGHGSYVIAETLSASIESVGDGWYRCLFSGVNKLNFTISFIAGSLTVDGLRNYEGDATSGFYFSSLQTEVSETATTYQRIVTPEITYVADVQPQPILYQNSTGTTPVTAVEQPVGLMLDKSRGLVLGSELVTNGTFDTDITGWTSGTASLAYWDNGRLALPDDGVNNCSANTSISLVPGTMYLLEITRDPSIGSANCYLVIGNTIGGGQSLASNAIPVGYSRRIFTASSASSTQYIAISNSTNNSTTFIDSISIKQLPGNHAFQATSAARPVLSARYNLLSYTEDFSNAYWTKTALTITANATTAPDGTTTADLMLETVADANHCVAKGGIFTGITVEQTGIIRAKPAGRNFLFVEGAFGSIRRGFVVDLTNGDMRTISAGGSSHVVTLTDFSVNEDGWATITYTASCETNRTLRIGCADVLGTSGTTSPSYVGDITKGIYIWGADLRLSNDGVDLPVYQRVDDTGTTGNYDTVGFPLYLKFDGVDDSLATNSIDFTATDKVTLWSGVRKQQDVILGIFTELSSAISNTGTFNVTAPGVSGTNIKFQFSSRGINVATPSTTSALYSAPISVVFTGIGDISGDSAILRLNGDEVAVNTSDQGESNYGNYPLYIGARNGNQWKFAGNCYSLIIRGAESTETEITDTETWVNEKTKAWS